MYPIFRQTHIFITTVMRVCRGLPCESRFQPDWTAAKVAQVFAVPAASRVANGYVWFRLLEDVPWLPWLPCSIHIRKQMPMFQSCSDQRWVLAARISTVSMKRALCQWRAAVAASVVFSELHHATSCSLPCITLI